MTTGIINGLNFGLWIDGVLIGLAKTAKISVSHENRSTFTKDDEWKTGAEGNRSWKAECSGLVAFDAAYGTDELSALIFNRTQVVLSFETGASGDTQYYGNGYLTSIELDALNDESTSYTASFEGVGELIQVDAPVTTIVYGYLYNWYAAADVNNIANTGWELALKTDYLTLLEYIEPGAHPTTNTAGAHLKSVDYFNSPNTGADDSLGFHARGAGYRWSSSFSELNISCALWCTSPGFTGRTAILRYDNAALRCDGSGAALTVGLPVRLKKTTTTLSNGQEGTYTGNDGKIYHTICIGTQEWLSENLCETKYRDGSSIPEVTDGTTWAGLTTGARCSYNNDESNAFTTE